LAGTIVQLWFQASVTWSPTPVTAFVTWLPNWALGFTALVNLLVVVMGEPMGRLIDGVIALEVCAVPMEIVT
jgi:hypothetical protein